MRSARGTPNSAITIDHRHAGKTSAAKAQIVTATEVRIRRREVSHPCTARRSRRRKTFLIIDNGPCHNLSDEGKLWLAAHRHRIELFRLPPYSPELNPIEGVWKVTQKRTTHNRFYRTTDERDDALRSTFGTFQARPELIANHVARFL